MKFNFKSVSSERFWILLSSSLILLLISISLISFTPTKSSVEEFSFSYKTSWSACSDINNRSKQGWMVKHIISQNVSVSVAGDAIRVIDKEIKGDIIVVFERRK